MKKGLIFLTVVLTLSIFISAAKAEEVTKTMVLTGEEFRTGEATNLILTFSIGGAKVNVVQSNEDGFIVKAVVTYDSKSADPTLKLGTLNDNITATFATGIGRITARQSIAKWDITIGNYNLDTNLIFNAGGITGSIDLGGMPLENCILNLGGVDLDIDFSTPTKTRVETLLVNSGGAVLSMKNIGNTDFKKFNWSGGGNIAILNFAGAYEREQHDVIFAGGGEKLDITVPSDAGEKLDIFSIATPVSVTGEGWVKKSSGVASKKYITDDYESQSVLIDFNMTGAGSIVSVNRE